MLNLGFFELTLFGVIALIVLGPEKLPVAARTLGKWYGKFRRLSTRLQSEFVSELQLLEVQEELKGELAKIRESEAKMKAQMAELQQSLNKTEQVAKANKQHILDAWQDNADEGEHQDTNPSKDTSNQDFHQAAALETTFNLPMVNHWFLLGDYDKKRRLPQAPFMPNYKADPLLYTTTS